MREIKFRAWDKRENRFVHADYETDPFEIYLDGTFLGLIGHEWEGGERFEVMQFTGLQDKNGKDIYEGDIVRLIRGEGVHTYDMSDPNPNIRIVTFHGEDAAFNLYMMDNKKQGSGLTFCKGNAEKGCFEIIGNIYENPKLLEDL